MDTNLTSQDPQSFTINETSITNGDRSTLNSINGFTFAFNIEIHFLPSNFDDKFKNLEIIQLSGVKLREIHQSHIDRLQGLKLIDLSFNEIEKIDKNLFVNNPELKFINFEGNFMKKVEILVRKCDFNCELKFSLEKLSKDVEQSLNETEKNSKKSQNNEKSLSFDFFNEKKLRENIFTWISMILNFILFIVVIILLILHLRMKKSKNQKILTRNSYEMTPKMTPKFQKETQDLKTAKDPKYHQKISKKVKIPKIDYPTEDMEFPYYSNTADNFCDDLSIYAEPDSGFSHDFEDAVYESVDYESIDELKN